MLDNNKDASEPPTCSIAMVLCAAILKTVICVARRYLTPLPRRFQVPRSCFTHVGTCKHRLKASSLQIADSSHTAGFL